MGKTIYVFDAGGSKTDLIVWENKIAKTYILPGYNPNRPESNLFFKELDQINIPRKALIYFYGSGLKSLDSQEKLKAYFRSNIIEFFSDIKAAIHSSKKEKGIIAICGTGSVVTYFNKFGIIKTRGGYGFLIDDYGGGLELGKKIISHWLSGDLSEESNKAISIYLNSESSSFIRNFYKNQKLNTIAGICKTIPALMEKDKKLNAIVNNYFEIFITDYLKPMTDEYSTKDVTIIGSIGWYFKSSITLASEKHGIKIDLFIKKPIKLLLDYHLTKSNMN